GVGDTVIFTTVHPEGQPTGVFWVDTDRFALGGGPLPAGGVRLLPDGKNLWVGGSDGQLYRAPIKGGTPAVFGPKLSGAPAALALLFEREELRFFSAGADQKLLSTHARGKLEPEDKGRGNNHTEPVTAMIWVPGDRFLTGSRDATVKTWPRVGNVKPATLKEGVGKVVGLARVEFQKKPHLAVACEDNTIRLFQLDEEGKFGEWTH